MTREELEKELNAILDYDMTLYDLYRAAYAGIRYGFEKGREQFSHPDWDYIYKSADEAIAELGKDSALSELVKEGEERGEYK